MGFVDAIVQSVIETNCSHAVGLVLALLVGVLLDFVEELLVLQEGLDFQHLLGKRSEHDGSVLLLAVTVVLPPVVEVATSVADHRADFQGNDRHEGLEVAVIELLPTILLDAGDTPHRLAGGGFVFAVQGFHADDFLEAVHELAVTAEDLRLRVVHVVAELVGADFGFDQHDGNRVGVREHRLVPDERRRGVVLARVVLLLGAGLTSGGSVVAHGVVVWFLVSLRPASPVVGSVVPRQINNTTDVVIATDSLLRKKEACCFVGFRITAFHSTTR